MTWSRFGRERRNKIKEHATEQVRENSGGELKLSSL